MRATVNGAMNKRPSIAEWRVSLWFVMLSPLLGIVLGTVALFVFFD